MVSVIVLVGLLAVSTALPTDSSNLVISKLGNEERFQYMRAGDGTPHLVDTWLKTSDVKKAARYTPDTQNVYHLFTRANPTVSQPMLLGSDNLLSASNFSPDRRTVFFIHGWLDSVTGDATSILVPAFLAAEDVNMIAVDWSGGSSEPVYVAAIEHAVRSGESVARFINWVNLVTGSTPAQYHVVGHSLGGQQAGIASRNVEGDVAYVTALDPALPGWPENPNRFASTDGVYTEVIHTNVGELGYIEPLGHADFYPNSGVSMPGCDSTLCDHSRCVFYMAESVQFGGFTGTQCASLDNALSETCNMPGTLQMGGIVPKTGFTGIYHLRTSDSPPFSLG